MRNNEIKISKPRYAVALASAYTTSKFHKPRSFSNALGEKPFVKNDRKKVP